MPDPNNPQHNPAQGHDDLPAHAHERLAQMRGKDGKRALFTSDL